MGLGHSSFEACVVRAFAGGASTGFQPLPTDSGEWRPLEPDPRTPALVDTGFSFRAGIGPAGSQVLTPVALVPVSELSAPNGTASSASPRAGLSRVT